MPLVMVALCYVMSHSNVRTADMDPWQLRDAPLTAEGKEAGKKLPIKLPWLYNLLDKNTVGSGVANSRKRVGLVASPLTRTIQTALYAFGHYVSDQRLKLELDGAL